MNTIGLAPNPLKIETVRMTCELVCWLRERGIKPIISSDIASEIGKPELGGSEEDVARADMLMVLGGDGTILRWSRLAVPNGTPIMGVNFGKYGFITEIHPSQVIPSLTKVLTGDYYVSERVVLKATLRRNDEIVGTYSALNDVVVSKGPLARMQALHLYVGGKFIVTYDADGIIVATPTGSTAYSLSAGGPVVHPDVSVMIVTPICPHTLNVRSLVVPDNETIQLIGECGHGELETMLTIDGQLGEHLTCSDVVEIGKSENRAKLIQMAPMSFYDKLQIRLRWGERLS